MGNLYFSFDTAAGTCCFGCSAVVLHRELQSAASGLACPQPLFTDWPELLCSTAESRVC